MSRMRFVWDGPQGAKLGDSSKDAYFRFRAEVQAVRWLPDYKIRKIWKAGLTVKDVENDKHYALFPTMNRPTGPQQRENLLKKEKRGSTLSRHTIELRMLTAALRAVENVLQYHRLEPDDLEWARAMCCGLDDKVRAIKRAHRGVGKGRKKRRAP